MPTLFFSCLQPHKLDLSSKVLRFKDGLQTYIGGVFDSRTPLALPDITKIHSGGFEDMTQVSVGANVFLGNANTQTRYLYWRHTYTLGKPKLARQTGMDIGDLCALVLPHKDTCGFVESNENPITPVFEAHPIYKEYSRINCE
jgi:hypothetical protein